MKNNLAYQFFLEKKDCELIAVNDFIEYLDKNNLFYKIFEVMKFEKNFFLYNGKKLKNKAKKIISKRFKQFIIHSDEGTKEGLKQIILNNTKFYNYINFDKFLNNELKIDYDIVEKIKNINDNFILTFHLKKLIKEKNFINKLENNFSVYIEIDEINTKLNEILNNLDNHNNKEIENKNNKIFDNIDNKVIKELFVLDNNFSKIWKKNINSQILIVLILIWIQCFKVHFYAGLHLGIGVENGVCLFVKKLKILLKKLTS